MGRADIPAIRAMLIFVVLTALNAPNVLAFNTSKVINVLKHPSGYGDHIALISHRGIVSAGCPENSACSIAAAKNGYTEAIELDVKASANGTLWLMHDQKLGRMTNTNFNMYKGTGPNTNINAVSDGLLKMMSLKDRNFNRTKYKMITLEDALPLTNGVVVILDLKNINDARRAGVIVRKVRATNRVILKISAGWYGDYKNIRRDVSNTVGMYTYFAITLYAGDLDKIARATPAFNRDDSTETHRRYVTNWVEWMINAVPGRFVFVEIGNKKFAHTDPTYLWVKMWGKSAIGSSQFVPVPEYPVKNDPDRSYGYVRSDSTCCADLSTYLTPTDFFGGEDVDDRPLIFQKRRHGDFRSYLTDSIRETHDHLSRLRLRQLKYYR